MEQIMQCLQVGGHSKNGVLIQSGPKSEEKERGYSDTKRTLSDWLPYSLGNPHELVLVQLQVNKRRTRPSHRFPSHRPAFSIYFDFVLCLTQLLLHFVHFVERYVYIVSVRFVA